MLLKWVLNWSYQIHIIYCYRSVELLYILYTITKHILYKVLLLEFISLYEINIYWITKPQRWLNQPTLRERSKRLATSTLKQISIIGKGHIPISSDSPIQRNLSKLILSHHDEPQLSFPILRRIVINVQQKQ